MSDTETVPIRVAGAVSIARLHGRACWHCGAVGRALLPAGLVQRMTGGRVWTVRTCGCKTAGVS